MNENETKDCPYCGEKIKTKAIKCKHCHSMLNTESRDKYYKIEQQQARKVIENEPAEKSKKPTTMSNSAFLGYTILVVFILLIIISSVVSLYQGRQDRAQETTRINEEPETKTNGELVDLPYYKIVSITDLSFGRDNKTKRFEWRIVVNEPINNEQFVLLSETLVEQAKEREPFNALIMFFYDYEEYITTSYTLGRAIYAPGGDWSEADTVITGDYKNMEFNLDYRNKDWSKQLTPDEVKVWDLWMETSDSLIEDELFPDDEVVDEIVASELVMDPEEVNRIIWKQINWTFMDE